MKVTPTSTILHGHFHCYHYLDPLNLQNNGDVTYRGLVTATPGSSVPEPTSLEIYDTAEDTPMVGGDSKTRKVKLVNSSRQSNV